MDEDTIAFNNIMTAFRLSKKTPEEKDKRMIEIEKATALVGSGPAYFIEFAQSLMKGFR